MFGVQPTPCSSVCTAEGSYTDPDKTPRRIVFIAIRVLSQRVLQFLLGMIVGYDRRTKFAWSGALTQTHIIKS